MKKPGNIGNKGKFEIYGIEMIEDEVKKGSDCDWVDLPLDWVGKHVKIVRIHRRKGNKN